MKICTCSGIDLQFLAGEVLQLVHVLLAAAGVGGDQVVGQELFLAGLGRDALETFFEAQQGLRAGLAHRLQDVLVGVLRGHLHLPGDVMLDQLAQVGVAHGSGRPAAGRSGGRRRRRPS